MYAVVDPEVGYVQGMNLLCGAVAFHMKDISSCFIFFKEIMFYGKLREFYLDNFSSLSQELEDLFHRQLKLLNMPLYDFLVKIVLCRCRQASTIFSSSSTTLPSSPQ